MNKSPKLVGVLALQGDFDAHRQLLETHLDTRTKEVRTPADLAGISGLILPGGESTTMIKLMQRFGLYDALREKASEGLPMFGTCAGMILLAEEIEPIPNRPPQPTLGVMNIKVARNAFGRQIDSFEADIPFLPLSEKGNGETVRGVFIRAPYVSVASPEVEVLSHFGERIVAVKQGNLLATAFHPELIHDPRVHAYFLEMIR